MLAEGEDFGKIGLFHGDRYMNGPLFLEKIVYTLSNSQQYIPTQTKSEYPPGGGSTMDRGGRIAERSRKFQ